MLKLFSGIFERPVCKKLRAGSYDGIDKFDAVFSYLILWGFNQALDFVIILVPRMY
jgi:hypothetical protein